MDFELNQSSTAVRNGVNPVRTAGDLLIEYRIEQGGAIGEYLVREWTGIGWGPADRPHRIRQGHRNDQHHVDPGARGRRPGDGTR